MALLKNRLFYGWVIVITFFIINLIIYGTNSSYGVFFKYLASDFNLTRTTTSAVFSTRMIVGALFAVLGGWAVDRFGPRLVVLLMGLITGLGLIFTSLTNSTLQLFMAYGVLLAFGTGACYTVIMSTVSRWFIKKRGLAIGICTSGGGLGQVIIPLFSAFMITKYDWRIAYFVMALMTLILIVPLSRLIRRHPAEIGVLPDGSEVSSAGGSISLSTKELNGLQQNGLSMSQALRTVSFWIILIIWLITALHVFLIITHIAPHVTDIGFSTIEGATVLSIIGISIMAGNVIMGTVSDRIGRKAVAITCSIVTTGVVLSLIWASELWMLYLFAVVYGFAQGGHGTTLTSLIGDTFGVAHIGKIFAFLGLGWAIGGGIGPLIGGMIYDINESYSLAFVIICVAMVIRTLLYTAVKTQLSS